MTHKYFRICQSCGWQQEAKDPATYVDKKTEAWRDTRCQRCKSQDLDYGSWRDITNWKPVKDDH